jgi:uncharacterized protein (TIGR00725 family)
LRVQVAVVGTASRRVPEYARRKAYAIGCEIAKCGCALVTGGCPGLPYEATRGAKAMEGLTVGISPAFDIKEHIDKYGSPVGNTDVMIYTGSGLMGREVTIVRSCDIIVIVGGRSGTLGEFSIAYDEGKIIGVLEGTGGITGIIRDIIKVVRKPTGAKVVFERDPERLMARLMKVYRSKPTTTLLN